MSQHHSAVKIGVAGCGALGSIVCKALEDGIDGYDFTGVSDLHETKFCAPHMTLDELVMQCDMIVECLPPAAVPVLTQKILQQGKTMVMISACAMLLYPEIHDWLKTSSGRILIPSGALCGLDAVSALAQADIDSAVIATTKPPKGLSGAPYVVQNNIALDAITEATLIFRGNALEAARAFPANVNVAATLSLAGIGAEKTFVEVWADPNAKGNKHEILVKGGSSTIRASVDNLPDPANPKSSMLAGHSIVAALRKQTGMIVVI